MNLSASHNETPATADRLSDDDFAFISSFAQSEAGLHIPPEKATMVSSRLNKRAKRLGINGLHAYCEFLKQSAGREEKQLLVSALTTNVTSFLRESHHFDYLSDEIVPKLKKIAKAGGRVRIWSAGCSSGQEPYSIAMTLLDTWPDVKASDVRILATDIDTGVLKDAMEGQYDRNNLENLPANWHSKYFTVPHPPSPVRDLLQVSPEVKSLIAFRHLNLIKPWPFSGKFDAIFCRNVVIYFHEKTQQVLWPRFEDACKEDGTIFVGHSERIEHPGVSKLTQVANTTYQKSSTKICGEGKGIS